MRHTSPRSSLALALVLVLEPELEPGSCTTKDSRKVSSTPVSLALEPDTSLVLAWGVEQLERPAALQERRVLHRQRGSACQRPFTACK
jgi:hypothetical protein